MLALRLARFDHLVDLGRVAELRGHRSAQRRRSSSAPATRDAALERDPTVAAAVPLLAPATPLIGHFQIRNRGTIGGSLAHADPAAEYPAVALAARRRRSTGVSAAARAPVAGGRLLHRRLDDGPGARRAAAAVALPGVERARGFAVEEFARRHGDFAIAGAVAAVRARRDDAVTRGARSRCSAWGHAVRAAAAERALAGQRPPATSTPAELGALAVRRRRRRRRRPARAGGVPPSCRRGVVADAWRGAATQAQDGATRWLSRRRSR